MAIIYEYNYNILVNHIRSMKFIAGGFDFDLTWTTLNDNHSTINIQKISYIRSQCIYLQIYSRWIPDKYDINHSYRTHIEGPHTMIAVDCKLLIQMLYQTSLLYPCDKIYSRCIPDMQIINLDVDVSD